MSKGLEELKKIKNYKEWTTVVTMGGYEKAKVKLAYNDELKASFSIIEKELKDKEQLEKAFDTLSKENEKVMKELSKEIEKNRALNEILALHDKWLGNEISDFEFFTLLSEIKDKYGLSKEALL